MVYIHDRLRKHFIKSSCDSTMWHKFDKCLFDVDSDLLLCIVYNVPKGMGEIFTELSVFISLQTI